jgi:type IX secretion system PorP/SprF family membrane protein
MRYFILLLCLLGLIGSVTAQQLPQYSLWILNPYGYNPAAAGTDNSLIVNAVYRQQWTDLDGAPVGQHVSAHLPVHFLSSGVGLRVENQTIGAHQTTQALLSANYQVALGASSTLAVGIGGGYQQYSLDGGRLRSPQGDYSQGNINHNDAWLPLGRISVGAPVVEAGVYFISERWQASAAAQPVFMPVLEERGGGQFRFVPRRQYTIGVAYNHEFNDNLRLKVGNMTKIDAAVVQSEVSAVLHWGGRLAAGGAWRGFSSNSVDAGILIIGTRLSEKIMLYYSYDIPISGLKVANRGSHEVMLRYDLQKPIGAGKLPPVIYNPRYI